MGFSRQEYWSGWPFPSPGDLPDPGIEPVIPAVAGRSLPLRHLGSPNEASEGPLFGKGTVYCRVPAQGHLTHTEGKVTSLTTDFGCFSVTMWCEFLLRTRTRSGHQGRAAGVDGIQQDRRQERSPGGRDSHYPGVQNLQPSEYLAFPFFSIEE